MRRLVRLLGIGAILVASHAGADIPNDPKLVQPLTVGTERCAARLSSECLSAADHRDLLPGRMVSLLQCSTERPTLSRRRHRARGTEGPRTVSGGCSDRG